MAKRLHHLCIQTNQYAQSLRFYRDILGFTLRKESPNFHDRDYNSWLELDGFFIELQTPKKGKPLEDFHKNTQGIAHMCFYTDHLLEDAAIFQQQQVPFSFKNGDAVYKVEDGLLFKILAPEGTIIEFRDSSTL